MAQNYCTTSLSLKAHPLSFLRGEFYNRHILSMKQLELCVDGSYVKLAGLVLIRRRPGTAGGICFITIEDETGVANLVVFASLFEKYRKEILYSQLLMVEGKVQKEGQVTHVVARRLHRLDDLLGLLGPDEQRQADLRTLAHPDEKDGEVFPAKNKRTQVRHEGQMELFPKGRNFR